MVGSTVTVGCQGADGLWRDGLELTVTAENAVELYEQDLLINLGLDDNAPAHPNREDVECWEAERARLETLRGRDLACWCAEGQPCHARVLLAVANR